MLVTPHSRWWFQIVFIFTPKIGEDEPILTHIFQMGWFNHQPVTFFLLGGYVHFPGVNSFGWCFQDISDVKDQLKEAKLVSLKCDGFHCLTMRFIRFISANGRPENKMTLATGRDFVWKFLDHCLSEYLMH